MRMADGTSKRLTPPSFILGTLGIFGVTAWLLWHHLYWVGGINFIAFNLVFKACRQSLAGAAMFHAMMHHLNRAHGAPPAKAGAK